MATGPSMAGEYVLLDVPGAGLTVIWSWSYRHDPAVLVESRPYVESLRFVTE